MGLCIRIDDGSLLVIHRACDLRGVGRWVWVLVLGQSPTVGVVYGMCVCVLVLDFDGSVEMFRRTFLERVGVIRECPLFCQFQYQSFHTLFLSLFCLGGTIQDYISNPRERTRTGNTLFSSTFPFCIQSAFGMASRRASGTSLVIASANDVLSGPGTLWREPHPNDTLVRHPAKTAATRDSLHKKNPSALPTAVCVHSARKVPPGATGATGAKSGSPDWFCEGPGFQLYC